MRGSGQGKEKRQRKGEKGIERAPAPVVHTHTITHNQSHAVRPPGRFIRRGGRGEEELGWWKMIVIGVRLVVGQENYDSQGKNRGNREQAGRQGNRKDRRPVRKGGIEIRLKSRIHT